MLNSEINITRFSAWAPGINSSDEWYEWAAGKREIESSGKSPDIAFTDPIFRRRLSQISKMTIQVVHDILPVEEGTKLFFISFRGELARQYQTNRMLIEENSLMPAAFSLSVFNAPAALATMAFGLKGGYCATYPGNGSFTAGLAAAEAALLYGDGKEIVFIYADEEVLENYREVCGEYSPPLAFALLLSKDPCSTTDKPDRVLLSSLKEAVDNPHGFLKQLLAIGEIHAPG